MHHLKTGSSESLVVNGNVTNFRITHNVVHDNNNIGIDVIGFERTAPDPAVDQARDGVVSGNLVYNIHSRGNPAYQNDVNSDGIYVDGGTRILIEQNVMHDVDFGIELASEHKDRATSYILARNNLIYHCHTAGVSIGGYDAGAWTHRAQHGGEQYALRQRYLGTPALASSRCNGTWQTTFSRTTSSMRAPHCLVSLIQSQVDKDHPPAVIDHNLYYCDAGEKASTWAGAAGTLTGFNKYVESTANDRHSHFLDPRFIDASGNDFHLQADSPAIGAGTTDGVSVSELDLEGSPRVQSGKIDLGCYQRK